MAAAPTSAPLIAEATTAAGTTTVTYDVPLGCRPCAALCNPIERWGEGYHKTFSVGGHVAPGFERVREVFVRHFEQNLERDAQCCVYVRGEKVVDLWGTRVFAGQQRLDGADGDDYAYDSGSVQTIFSSGKVLTSVVVAMLVDRGLLRYDQLVTDVWPEYGQNGKESTTLAMVMKHEAGLYRFDEPMDVEAMTREGVKGGRCEDVVARQTPAHVPGAERHYHPWTRGWIVNEIVRRVDPKRRTVGQILQEDIAEPLGLANELMLGVPEDVRRQRRVARLVRTEGWWFFGHICRPQRCGGLIEGGCPIRCALCCFLGCNLVLQEACGCCRLDCCRRTCRERELYMPKSAAASGSRSYDEFNADETRACEMPSVNHHASARALAKVAAVVAGGGQLDDVRLLSEEGVAAGHANPTARPTFLGGGVTTFTDMGVSLFNDDDPNCIDARGGFIGWMGHGGSCMQWHRELDIGFGYAMSKCSVNLVNPRSRRLQRAVLECLGVDTQPSAPSGEAASMDRI